MSHTVTLKEIEPVTHDTYHLRFNRPDGYAFQPGQAADVSFQIDGIGDEKRPFTFVSGPDQAYLDFIIKSYPEHEGVTAKIPNLKPGDQAELSDAWGAIKDEGAGVFVAGGAGITPFIAILRDKLRRDGTLAGNRLIFANDAEKDIILRDEFEQMPGLDACFVITGQQSSNLPSGPIDEAFLGRYTDPLHDRYYICGPDGMVKDLSSALTDLGADKDCVVIEDL